MHSVFHILASLQHKNAEKQDYGYDNFVNSVWDVNVALAPTHSGASGSGLGGGYEDIFAG